MQMLMNDEFVKCMRKVYVDALKTPITEEERQVFIEKTEKSIEERKKRHYSPYAE